MTDTNVMDDWIERVPSFINQTFDPEQTELLAQYTYNRVEDVRVVFVGSSVFADPSLFMDELQLDYGHIPNSEDFNGWFSQGVMLLDLDADMDLVLETMELISENTRNTVFVLLGEPELIDMIRTRRHCVINIAEPSHTQFYGTRPFTRANDYLYEHGRPEVYWDFPEKSS